MDVFWCLCNWSALSDCNFCVVPPDFSWILHHIWASFHYRAENNSCSWVCLLLDSCWLSSIRTLLLSECSFTNFWPKCSWTSVVEPFLYRLISLIYRIKKLIQLSFRETGSYAAKLFRVLLYDIPPHIPELVVTTGTVDNHWRWWSSCNAWRNLYKIHDVQVCITVCSTLCFSA